ncbi:protein Tos6p [[Candida] railenensis]|uniref:Protein Tos6p n=1 Tax=[Candida] railenensis TaxID=45579 RepID=A0A9P0VX79_9ASCO|nr:protein Tos6p [[Candida] railenensis]
MQFSTVAILASAALVSATTVTETESSSTLVTITSCGSEVTDCPAASTSASNSTVAPSNVTTWENGANKQFAAAGVAALAAGALLAL